MTDSQRDAIARRNDEMAKYFAANDMASLKNLYTDDCRVMPEGSETLIGKDAVPSVFGSLIEGGAAAIKLTTDELGPLGGGGADDTIFERGHLAISKSDGSSMGTGKFVVIWKHTSDGYKIYIDIFNNNK